MKKELVWTSLALLVMGIAILSYGWLCAVTELQSVNLPMPPSDKPLYEHVTTCKVCSNLGEDGFPTMCEDAFAMTMAIFAGNENFKYSEVDGFRYIGPPIKDGWWWNIEKQKWVKP